MKTQRSIGLYPVCSMGLYPVVTAGFEPETQIASQCRRDTIPTEQQLKKLCYKQLKKLC